MQSISGPAEQFVKVDQALGRSSAQSSLLHGLGNLEHAPRRKQRPLCPSPDALPELQVLFLKVPPSHQLQYIPIHALPTVKTFFLLSSLKPLCCN